MKEVEIVYKKECTVITVDDSFSTVSRKKRKGVYSIYTLVQLKSIYADMLIERGINVQEVDFSKGFITFKRNENMDYDTVIEHICDVLYQTNLIENGSN